MQVAPQPAAFFLACFDEPFAGKLQVAGELHGVYGNACLARQVIQQAPISWAKPFAGRTWSQ